jgi:hypothetical protein
MRRDAPIGPREAQALHTAIAQLRKRVDALERAQAGMVVLGEISDPGNGSADTVRVYARDNGAGKTQVVAVFSSGAVQVLATQP